MKPASTFRLQTLSFFQRAVPFAVSGWGATLAMGAAVGFLSTAGCGSDSESPACEAGALVACAGPQGCQGEQVCAADGASLGPCECDGATANAGGSGTSDGAGGSEMSGGAGGSEMGGAGGGAMADVSGGAAGAALTSTSAVNYVVGAPCESDAECSGDLTCITEAMPGVLGVGGPANGYCSMPCQSNAQCREVDPFTACQGTSATSGFCITACQGGVEGAKCVGPEGLRLQACTPPPPGGDVDVCLPRCSKDSDCSEGRVCDPGITGGCVDAPPAGGGDGAPCTADTEAEDCASGFCLELTEGRAVCAGFCTFGASLGCGFEDGDTSRTAACIDTITVDGGGGDLGFCYELCEVGTDCIQEGSTCELFSDPENASLVGRAGFCEPAPVTE